MTFSQTIASLTTLTIGWMALMFYFDWSEASSIFVVCLGLVCIAIVCVVEFIYRSKEKLK